MLSIDLLFTTSLDLRHHFQIAKRVHRLAIQLLRILVELVLFL